MAIINTYSNDSTIHGEDKLIGSDGTTGADAGKTKNYQVDTLTSYVSSNLSGNIKMTGLTNAADDSAAATAGVAVGQVYRNGSVLQIRVA